MTSETVARLNSAFLDQETGQRGFMLSGSASALQPYQLGVAAAAQLERDIRSRLPHDEVVINQLDAVRSAADAWRTQVAVPTIAARSRSGRRLPAGRCGDRTRPGAVRRLAIKARRPRSDGGSALLR